MCIAVKRTALIALLTWALHGCASTMRDNIPSVNYVPDSSYYLIMAEIALQREQQAIAAQEYLNAATHTEDAEIAQRATEFAFERGYLVYALPAARRWVELDPANRRAHEYAARAYMRRSALDASLEHWRQALGPLDERDEQDYDEVSAAIAEGQNAAAVTWMLTRLSADAPDSGALRLALARAALRSRHFDLALASAQRAVAAGVDRSETTQLIAEAHLLRGEWAAAQKLMEEELSKTPQLALEIEYIQMIAAAGEYRRARDELEQLAKDYGVQPPLIRLHGLMSLAAGDIATAESEFQRLLEAGYEIYECFYFLGQIAEFRKQYDDAIGYYSRISSGPYLVQAQIAIAQAYADLGDEHGALDHLSTFSASHPLHYFEILNARARLYERFGEYAKAVAIYDEILRFQPDVISLLNARSIMLDLNGEVDEALRAMRRTLQLAPTNADTMNTLGYTLTNRTNRHKEAYALVRAALELEPDNPAIIDSMGWVLFKLGKLEEARSYLELAHAQIEDPEIVAHLGEVMWKIGDKAAARAMMDSSHANFPDSEPLNATMQRLLE